MKPRRIIIVGGGVAGHRCAVELRRCGFDGALMLVGAEPNAPYDRTLLSKDLVQGRVSAADLALLPPAEYEAQGIELRLGVAAAALAPDQRELTLADGTVLHYDRLVLATGAATPRPAALCGAGGRVLRTLHDAMALRAMLADCRKLVVIGGGFVGAEVAASARSLGISVTMLEALDAPLARTLGVDVGERIADLHRANSVEVLTKTVARAVRRADGDRFEVEVGDGRTLAGDAVLVGVGMVPAIDWLSGSGITRDGGVITDSLCRTSVPGVVAAGDCTRWFHRSYDQLLHVEHWDTAARHGVAAARAAIGEAEAFAPVPFFWSVQHGVRFQWIGQPGGWDSVEIEDDDPPYSFVARYRSNGRITAVLAAGNPRAIVSARRELESREEVFT